jgi:pyrroloquinoline quinone (PQQ) biosynthesis protein C
MSSVFGQLVIRTDESRRAFETHPVLMEGVSHGLSVERYRALLLELYHVVWHFNPIAAAAASRMPDTLREVRYFLYEHMSEESGHEGWVRNDLEAVGVPPQRTQAYAAGIHTMAMTGYNYWCADRRHPASVLGMFYALEVIASVYGGPFASAIRESLLLDGDHGVSFISSHATLDAEHMAELRTIINRIDAAALEAVVESAEVNFHHLTQIIASV